MLIVGPLLLIFVRRCKVKKYLLPVSLLISTLLLTGVFIGLAYAQGQTQHDSLHAQADSLSTAFTYQGQLKDTNGPVTDDCQMAFRLYDHVNAGNQIGEALSTTVPITDGLFTVNLDFGSTAFSGDALWLDIKVKCTDDSVYTDLSRQALTAAPYALHAASTGALQGYPITTTAPTTGQLLSWDGDNWVPATPLVTGVLSETYGNIPSYPFEFDISALGDVPPSSVTVVASGFKATSSGRPESPLMIDWEVTETPTLTLRLHVWDADGIEYFPTDAAWINKSIKLSFVATAQ
jgi:hypothetical protein